MAMAITTVYTNEAAFIAAIAGRTQSVIDFESSPQGDIDGTEFSAQGMTFSSPLAGEPGQLEVAPPDSFAATQYLNVGERPFVCCDGDNDSLFVDIVGNWYAAGFGVVDSLVPGTAESIRFLGNSSNLLYLRTSADEAVPYLGIVTDEPIRRIVIVEAADDGDDVGYDNFRLAVPEPGAIWLAAVAAGFVIVRCRSR
jgi:hypothetical protein